jgi:hypothetical protein
MRKEEIKCRMGQKNTETFKANERLNEIMKKKEKWLKEVIIPEDV